MNCCIPGVLMLVMRSPSLQKNKTALVAIYIFKLLNFIPRFSLVKLGISKHIKAKFKILWVSHPCNSKRESVDPSCVGVRDMKVDTLNLHTHFSPAYAFSNICRGTFPTLTISCAKN